MTSKPLNELTIIEASSGLAAGDFSSLELTEACLTQIRGMNGVLNAFLDVYEDDARVSATQSDDRRKNDVSLGSLDGIPLAIKDNMTVQGKRCTAGSNMLANYQAVSDATVIRKLKEQGSVILGKTNLDEFSMGSSTEHSAFGPTKNPHDPERVPGGTSGGSACAVAAHLCIGALGSDTGGSIRQPASFCGIVGLKPTYGRVSRSGLIAMTSSFDQIGPMTKNVEDAEILLQAIQGRDPLDQTTADEKPFSPSVRKDLRGLRIGLPKQAWGEGVSQGVRDAMQVGIEQLRSLGAEIIEIDLPYTDEALAVYYLLMPCEVSTNLARFDGMRYGFREPSLPLHDTYAQTRSRGFGKEARRRILLGTFALSHGYYDAYYVKAKKVQRLIRQAYERAYLNVDLLLTPTAPTTAFKIGEKTSDPLTMYLEDIFTVAINVAGVPAISIPCGTSEGLPVGMQLIAPWFKEDQLFATSKRFLTSFKTS